ncbi:MAG: transglycosylase SLT domain-containing protein [Bacteroidia bacterium]|nr:transglycosylase SLT domain-containing protein [Bacteroidia bacterium]
MKNNRLLLLLPGLLLIFQGISAQIVDPNQVPDSDDMTEFFTRMDSMVADFHYKPSSESMDSTILNTHGYAPGEVPTFTDQVYAQRLKDLGYQIPMDYNEYVKAFIKVYTVDRREQVRRMLGLQHVFFPIFEEVLDREKMPMELKYLSVVESALNPHARSRAGATGLWQFMYYTGKQYGLQTTTYVDERSDPWKSTEAAIRYFQNMYKVYNDWLLVIAAYNCGPGNVNKAIRLSGGKTNFWEIRENLPRETRGYVPAFIAACYAMNYASEHNIYPVPLDFTYHQDTIHITRQKINLHTIAEITGADFYELKDLNPELKFNYVPYTPAGYVLRVPHATALAFTLHRDSVYTMIAALNPDSILKKYKDTQVSPITRSSYIDANAKTGIGNGEQTLVYYKVRKGDVVGKIADRYHVSASKIAIWNNLYHYQIKPGQNLKIYVSGDGPAPEKTASAATTTQAKAEPVIMEEGKKYHKVQSGDTLWDIANKYEGVSVTTLKQLNKLPNNQLKPGQLLKLN